MLLKRFYDEFYSTFFFIYIQKDSNSSSSSSSIEAVDVHPLRLPIRSPDARLLKCEWLKSHRAHYLKDTTGWYLSFTSKHLFPFKYPHFIFYFFYFYLNYTIIIPTNTFFYIYKNN